MVEGVIATVVSMALLWGAYTLGYHDGKTDEIWRNLKEWIDGRYGR